MNIKNKAERITAHIIGRHGIVNAIEIVKNRYLESGTVLDDLMLDLMLTWIRTQQ